MYNMTVETDDSVRLKASERVYRTLLDEIQSGLLAPGTVLGEVEHAERLGVSRTPLREALRRLGADGLVTQVSPRMTVVTPIDRENILALFEVRRALEELAARLAAARGDVDQFASLAAEFAAIQLDHDAGYEGYYALIRRFDQALDDAVDNDYLISALRTIRTHLVRVRRLAKAKPRRLEESVTEHRLIAEAVAARDPELAAHATHIHLHNALTNVLEHLERATPDRGRNEGES